MTTTEFSTEFDVLYNNITSNQAPGLNLYEKSVFLTKAQSQLMSEYFSKRLDNFEGGFDGSPKRQIDFSSIMEWNTLERITQDAPKFDPRSILYAMPDDVLFIVNEQLSLLDYNNISYNQADTDTFYSVVPVSYENYARLMSKPYKYPPKNQAWRLITKKLTTEIPGETIPAYWSYTTIHTQVSVYVTIGGTTELAFTVEYDSNIDNADPVNIAIVTTNFDYSGLTGVTVFEIPDMEKPIGESLEAMFATATINNLRFSIDDLFKDRKWSEFWGDEIVMQATNQGSIATHHPEEIIESTTKVQQLLEIIGRFASTPYYRMRYVRRPKPIILEPRLDELQLSIEGIGYGDGNTYTWTPTNVTGLSTITECELPEEMHHEILERAVTLAKIAWQGTTMTQAASVVQTNK